MKPFIGLPTDYYLYPLWMLAAVFSGRLGDAFRLNKTNVIFLAMIAWIIISMAINPKNGLSSKILVDYIKFFLISRLVVASIKDFAAFRRVILFLLFLVFVLVLESIHHKFALDGLGWAGQSLGWADDAILRTSGTGRTQWISIFDGPGVFCVLFTIALPFIIQHFDKHYSAVIKMSAALFLTPLVLAIYYTGSRGGFLASVACLFSYVLSRSKLSLKQLIVASLLSSMLFMAAPAFLTSTHDSHGSAQNRVDVWKEGLEMTRYNPVFGIGKGNFASYTGTLIAHNSAIEVMGETGLPGLFLWLSLIVVSFKEIWNFYVSTENLNQKSYAMALAICIIGYLASAMFVTLEYETFYFLLGLAAALGSISGRQVEFSKKNCSMVVCLVFGWLILLKSFFMIY